MKHSCATTLPHRLLDDKNGLSYTLQGDYYLPDIKIPETPPLGRWGRMALDYLKKQQPGRFTRMLLNGTLYPHCHALEQQAQECFDFLMEGYQRCRGLTEELKARDPMKWVGLMSNAQHEAEKDIFEMLYNS